MAETFVDRQSTYPNRYKITHTNGTVEYVVLERADNPTVTGTPLTAATFNQMVGWVGLKNMLADGNTILSSNQYGDTLPAAGNAGRIFFKKVTD